MPGPPSEDIIVATKRYRIGRQPHFDANGVLRYEGEIVEIPEDQEPAPGWFPVGPGEEETKTEIAPETKTKTEDGEEIEVRGVVLRKGGRAADRKL